MDTNKHLDVSPQKIMYLLFATVSLLSNVRTFFKILLFEILIYMVARLQWSKNLKIEGFHRTPKDKMV